MKLSLDCTFLLIVLMTCIELFVTARPAGITQGKNGLEKLHKDMRRLLTIVSQEKEENNLTDFDHTLTSLPSLSVTTEDLKSLEVSSTLAQLYSGLKSFKFHLDWIQQKQDETWSDHPKKKQIAHLIQDISNTVLNQMGTPPPELVHPSLPPLKTTWSLHQANVEIHEKLYYFCLWYARALGVLKHRQ